MMLSSVDGIGSKMTCGKLRRRQHVDTQQSDP
jgi:hypothetical protein